MSAAYSNVSPGDYPRRSGLLPRQSRQQQQATSCCTHIASKPTVFQPPSSMPDADLSTNTHGIHSTSDSAASGWHSDRTQTQGFDSLKFQIPCLMGTGADAAMGFCAPTELRETNGAPKSTTDAVTSQIVTRSTRTANPRASLCIAMALAMLSPAHRRSSTSSNTSAGVARIQGCRKNLQIARPAKS